MLTATKCQCGAITIEDESFSNSMTQETFDNLSEVLEVTFTTHIFSNCNHCVNNWGIDLCGCGSGEPVGKCDEEFEDCKNRTPAQQLFGMKEIVGWRN